MNYMNKLIAKNLLDSAEILDTLHGNKLTARKPSQ